MKSTHWGFKRGEEVKWGPDRKKAWRGPMRTPGQ
jgi:hypothetical protein